MSDFHIVRIAMLIPCPNCAQKLRLPPNKGNLIVNCPKCNHKWLRLAGDIITEKIIRIKTKLEIARTIRRKANPNYQSNSHEFYGVCMRSFDLNPPLSSDKVDAWEIQYKATIPMEYRSFLEQIGNGGCGPFHGILPLEKWDDGMDFEKELVLSQCPSQPCLLLEEYQDMKLWQLEIIGQDWQEDYDNEVWSPQFGTITISTGIEDDIHLILNGPLRGRICSINEYTTPVIDPSLSFLDWYENWLNYIIDI